MAVSPQVLKRIRKKMIDLDLTVTELAEQISSNERTRRRESVSRAIHHGLNPNVLREVRELLDV